MESKICTKCKIKKDLSEFCNNKNAPEGKHWWCKECQAKNQYKWNKINKNNRPWINSYNNAKQRCENPNNPNYPWWGARGIQFLLSKKECARLWERDNASQMKFPTIDRIDNNGNYTFNNCQFLENVDNSEKDRYGHWMKNKFIKYTKIGQYSLTGNLIKIWKSQGEASRELNLSQGDISHCINGKKVKQVGGYLWKKI